MTKEEMVGWHHRLNGHEFGDGRGKPGVLQSMGSDMTERLMCQNGVAVKRLEMSLFLRETVKGFTERWLIRT